MGWWRKVTASDSLTRFMIRVRSPWASSSGVGGRGRFGGPPWLFDPAAEFSLDRIPIPPPGLNENSGLIRNGHNFHRLPNEFNFHLRMKNKVNERVEIKELTVALADRSQAKFHRFLFGRLAHPARCPSLTCQSDLVDLRADCCYCYCSEWSAWLPLLPPAANGCFSVALQVAIVTVGARFPIHLIVLLTCPNPNRFQKVVCVWGVDWELIWEER